MSYAKLFGSILDSTVWQESKETRLVWITMLAMKDQDGIVEAAIPGLARRAGVSLEETEAALATLMKPDPYSRTPDHDGRRIAVVDGGWMVLNHDKYRAKEDAAERRDKEATRKAKQRERKAVSRVVPPCPAVSRVVPSSPAMSSKVTTSEADTDHPDRGAGRGPDGPGSGLGRLQLPDPSHDGGGERAIGREAVRAAGLRVPQRDPAVSSRVSTPRPVPGDPRAAEHSRLLRELTRHHVEIFNRARTDLGAKVPAMQPIGDPSERALRALLAEQVSLDGFEARARHVLEIRDAEARRINSVKFLGASLWDPKSFGIAVSMALGEDRRGQPKRSAFDAADEVFDALEQRERDLAKGAP